MIYGLFLQVSSLRLRGMLECSAPGKNKDFSERRAGGGTRLAGLRPRFPLMGLGFRV